MSELNRREDQRLAAPEQPLELQSQRRSHSGVEDLQRTAGNARLIQMRSAVQRHPSELPAWLKDSGALTAMDAPAMQQQPGQQRQQEVESAAESISIPSGGQPLDPAVQRQVEEHHGVGMDDVRVVANGDSACKPIQAQAFTTEDAGRPTVVLGNDVNLGSADGQFTLMHELSHVAQQKKGQSAGLDGLGGDAGQRNALELMADEDAHRLGTKTKL